MRVTVKDNGYNALVKTLTEAAHAQVNIGISAADGAHAYDSGRSLAEVAEIHEFGLDPRIPQRSFVRGWFDENRNMAQIRLRLEMSKVVRQAQSYATGLQVFADYCARGMKDRIDTRAALAANAPSTIAKKGFDYPLVETGVLRHAIKGHVDK